MEKYKDNFINHIDQDQLVGKTIKKDDNKYQIVACQKKDDSLYVAFANVDFYVGVYGEAFTEAQIKQMQNMDVSNVEEFYDLIDIHCDIIKINNCMLMRRDADQPVEEADFCVVSPLPTELFVNREIYRNSFSELDDINNPFVINKKPVYRCKDIVFTTEEKQLRKLFYNAMPEHVAELYKHNLTVYCYNKMTSLNNEYFYNQMDNAQQTMEQMQKISNNKTLPKITQQQAKKLFNINKAAYAHFEKERQIVMDILSIKSQDDNLEL